MADQLITGTTLVEKESRSVGDCPVGAVVAWLKSFAGVPNLPENYRECEERWWLDIILDIYSKEANIRQLRREKIVRSPKDFDNFLKISEYDDSWCPWIPGLSFLTDGFQQIVSTDAQLTNTSVYLYVISIDT